MRLFAILTGLPAGAALIASWVAMFVFGAEPRAAAGVDTGTLVPSALAPIFIRRTPAAGC